MTILITGGTKGIGLAIALRLARPGETLVLAYLNDKIAAAQASAKIAEKGAHVVSIAADVGTIQGCARLMTKITKLGGGRVSANARGRIHSRSGNTGQRWRLCRDVSCSGVRAFLL